MIRECVRARERTERQGKKKLEKKDRNLASRRMKKEENSDNSFCNSVGQMGSAKRTRRSRGKETGGKQLEGGNGLVVQVKRENNGVKKRKRKSDER